MAEEALGVVASVVLADVANAFKHSAFKAGMTILSQMLASGLVAVVLEELVFEFVSLAKVALVALTGRFLQLQMLLK